MQKIKMEVNGTVHFITPRDLLRVTYVETLGEFVTVEGYILEDELFGLYTLIGKQLGKEGVEKNYLFMGNDIISMEMVEEMVEKTVDETVKTKRVVVLGLRDIQNEYHLCPSLAEYTKVVKLKQNEFVEGKVIEVFPYTNFTTFSKYDVFLYDLVYLEVDMEMTQVEYDGLSASWIKLYQFHNKRVKLIREVDEPWAYALDLVKDMDKESSQCRNILYGLKTWASMLHFRNYEEIERFFQIWDGKEVYLSKENMHLLPRFLESPLKKIHISHNNGPRFSVREYELMEMLLSLDKDKLVTFTYATSYQYLEKVREKVRDKAFFEKLITLDQTFRYDVKDYLFFIEYMPEGTIEEYGADELLELCDEQLHYLKKENDEEPWASDDYDIDCDYSGDEDDECDDFEEVTMRSQGEADSIRRLLCRVTEKSLPLLQTYDFSSIKPYLAGEIVSLLECGEMVS